MTFKRPKAILFDWDNTLADTWPTIHHALTETFVAMGHEPWSLEDTKRNVHRSMRDSFPEIFGDHWEKAADLYQSHFRAIHLEKLLTLTGAKDVLEHLATTGIYVALVSNKTGSNLRKEVDHLGWQPYFKKVVGAKDATADKPASEPILLALEGSGINMDEDVWLIGDSITDMECAYNSGITPIFYGDGDLADIRFVNYQPKKHLHNHDELLAFIKSITA